MVVEIHIEYCGQWGYLPKAQRLRDFVVSLFNDKVNFTLEQGRVTSFEVKVNNEKVHSKIAGQGWPKDHRIAEIVEKILGEDEA